MFWQMLLPEGHPHSTSKGFVDFCAYQAAAAACGAAASTVATTALLSSFFASAAALGWLMKDMLPNAAAVIVANKMPVIDDGPDLHFVTAQTLTAAVVVSEVVLAQACPPLWLPYAAASTSFVRSAGMIRMSSSRASMLQHFALKSNVGDLQAKLQSWVLISYTCGACVGATLVVMVPAASAQMTAVVLLSAMSVGFSYLACQCYSPRVVTSLNIVGLCEYFQKHGTVPEPDEARKMPLSPSSNVAVLPLIDADVLDVLEEFSSSSAVVTNVGGNLQVFAGPEAQNETIVAAVIEALGLSDDMSVHDFFRTAKLAGWNTDIPFSEHRRITTCAEETAPKS